MEAAREAAKAVAAVGYIAERSGQQQQNVQLQINEQQNVAQTAALAKLEQPLTVMEEAVAHVAQKPVLGQDNEKKDAFRVPKELMTKIDLENKKYQANL